MKTRYAVILSAVSLLFGAALATTNQLGTIKATEYVVTSESDPNVPDWAKRTDIQRTNDINAIIRQYDVTNLTDRISAKVEQCDIDATLALSNVCSVTEAQKMTNGVVTYVKEGFVMSNAIDRLIRYYKETSHNDFHAEGYMTKATGTSSHSEGRGTIASGRASHAEGDDTEASGWQSHAEGNNTIAAGASSHAEGFRTRTTAEASHSEGVNSFASNITTFVWQGTDKTNANGKIDFQNIKYYGSHGAGTYNVNPVGGLSGFWIGETNLATHLDAAGGTKGDVVTNIVDGIVASSNLVPFVEDYLGNKTAVTVGTRYTQYTQIVEWNGNYTYHQNDIVRHLGTNYICVIDPKSRTEHVTWENQSQYWKEIFVGDHSVSIGIQNTANSGVVQGGRNFADGSLSHAEGEYSHAEGEYSHAEGLRTRSVGSHAHSEGKRTTAAGAESHAEGNHTSANGNWSHAEGIGSIAGAEGSHAEGVNANATNNNSFVWQGWTHPDDYEYAPFYGSHGPGTFNINPVGGLSGLWIGETNMADRISEMTNAMEAAGTERQIVRGAYNIDDDIWDINVDFAVGAEEAYSVTWDNVQDTPESLGGYGITDAYTKSQSESCATNAATAVVGANLYYASTNLADNVELRLFSGEWVNAEYDGVGTAAVILDLTGVPTDKVTDTLMVLNCAATGTLTVATSADACRVIHKKDANPLELKAGLNLLTFSRYRMENGTNEVLVTNNELE